MRNSIPIIVAICLLSSLASAQLTSSTPTFSHQYKTLNSARWNFIDTSFNSLKGYYNWTFTERDLFGSSRLYNLGMPLNPLVYTTRPSLSNNYGFLGLESQSFQDTSVRFYYVRSALTEAQYRMGYDRGQVFRIRHTQNINEHWNGMLSYTRINSTGLYNRSSSEGMRFMASTYYSNPKNGFNVRSYFIQERLNLNQSGGIESDSLFENNVFSNRILIDARLPNAEREHRKRVFNNNVSYNFLKYKNRKAKESDSLKDSLFVDSLLDKSVETKESGDYFRIGHQFNYQSLKQTYEDAGGGDFYANSYFSDAGYKDSNAFYQVDNTVYLEANVGDSSNFGVIGGIRHSYQNYSQEEFLIDGNNLAFTGGLNGKLRDYINLSGKVDYIFAGPLRESFYLNSSLGLKIYKSLSLTGGYSINFAFPDIKTQFYRSNHFIWQNNFSKISENILQARLAWKTGGLGVKNILVNNYLYFNSDALPEQFDGLVAILQFNIEQNFTFWNFLHFDNKLVYQLNNEKQGVLPLPDLVTRNALYFEFALFKKELKCLLGADVNYFSLYSSPSYMPATGVFYVENRYDIGNYPLFNVFANFQLKSAELYVKYEHVNQGLNGYRYYAAPSYPFNDRVLLLGLNWRFFN